MLDHETNPSTRPDECDQKQILFFLGQMQELDPQVEALVKQVRRTTSS